MDTSHRRNLSQIGLMSKRCDKRKYEKDCFLCDIASFCGMVIDTNLIRKIGLPHKEYFIWYDDTEYSLRIHEYSRFLVVTKAELNHKTELNTNLYPRRYDRIVNFIDLFIHVIFRNWLFGVIKRDGYDWKYERDLVKKAIRNYKRGKMENIILK